MQHLSRLEITDCVRSMRSGELWECLAVREAERPQQQQLVGEGEGSICMNNEAPRPAGMEASGTGEELKLRRVEGDRRD